MQKQPINAFCWSLVVAKKILFCSLLLCGVGFGQPSENNAPPPPNGGFVNDVPEVGIDNNFWFMITILCGLLLLKKYHLFQQKASNYSVLKQQ